MHTIGEAAYLLGVSRLTVEKWCKRLGITPERHPQDWRYRTLTDEEVEAIRAERAKMPGRTLYPPVRAPQPNLGEQTPKPSQLPLAPVRPRQRPVSASSSGLPEGLVSLTAAAETHGVERFLSTFRHWRDEGKLDCDPGKYGGVRGQFAISRPLTRRGLAQFVALAHGREGWRDCPLCPHEEDTFRDTGGDTAAAR